MTDYVTPASTRAARWWSAAAGRRGLALTRRPTHLHCVLQGAACAAHPQRRRAEPASVREGVLCRRRPASCATPRSPPASPDGVVQVVAEPSIPPHRRVDDRRAHRRDPRHRRGACCAMSAYESGNPAIGCPGNVPVLAGRHCRPGARGREAGATAKAFDNSVALHQRRASDRRRVPWPTGSARDGRRGPYVLDAEERDRVPRHASSPRAASTRRSWARTRRPSPPRAGSACPAARGSSWLRSTCRRRGAARPREAVPGPRRRPGAQRAPRDPYRRRRAAHRRRRPLRGHPQQRPARRSWTTQRPCTCCGCGQRGGSTGSAGFGTHLAPSMTIGTGFVGAAPGREPRAQTPRELHAHRLQHRPERGTAGLRTRSPLCGPR
jgi:hypothetical protein